MYQHHQASYSGGDHSRQGSGRNSFHSSQNGGQGDGGPGAAGPRFVPAPLSRPSSNHSSSHTRDNSVSQQAYYQQPPPVQHHQQQAPSPQQQQTQRQERRSSLQKQPPQQAASNQGHGQRELNASQSTMRNSQGPGQSDRRPSQGPGGPTVAGEPLHSMERALALLKTNKFYAEGECVYVCDVI